VTVLFADVVRSMDIATAVGAQRWRAITAALISRLAGVFQRYGGTVDQFSGERVVAFRRPMREGLRCANLFV
jgi:class 3 adenylate cyclase